MVEAITPQAGASIAGDWVSLKNAAACYIAVHINQVAVNTVAITVQQATNVSGGSAKVITVATPIRANEDCAATDTLVAQTAAVGFTTSAAQKHKIVIIRVDAADLDMANGFDCIKVLTAASDATNITSALYFLTDIRYAQATPPSAIID